MKIPKTITDNHIDNSLSAGRVLKRKMIFDGKEYVKRLIVVTNNNKDTILTLKTTSNTSPRKYYNKDDILVKAGKENIFELNTYIQLNGIIKILNEKLKNEFQQKKLIILGKISESLLNAIYKKIREKPELIEGKYIKRIIQEQ